MEYIDNMQCRWGSPITLDTKLCLYVLDDNKLIPYDVQCLWNSLYSLVIDWRPRIGCRDFVDGEHFASASYPRCRFVQELTVFVARKVRKDRLHLRSNLYINFKDLDYPNFDFCVPNIFQDQDFQTNRHFVHYNKLQRVRSVHSRAKMAVCQVWTNLRLRRSQLLTIKQSNNC